MANRMTPPAEGQEKDVLLVLDKQQGKVSAVKGIDKEGNLQTVPPTHGGEFMQVDKNSDVFSNFISNWKIQCKLPPKTKRFCPLVLK